MPPIVYDRRERPPRFLLMNMVIAAAMFTFAAVIGVASESVCTFAFFALPATAHVVGNIILLGAIRIWVDDTHLHCAMGRSFRRKSYPLRDIAKVERSTIPTFVLAWRGWPARRMSDGTLLFRLGATSEGVLVTFHSGTRAFYGTTHSAELAATLQAATTRAAVGV